MSLQPGKGVLDFPALAENPESAIRYAVDNLQGPPFDGEQSIAECGIIDAITSIGDDLDQPGIRHGTPRNKTVRSRRIWDIPRLTILFPAFILTICHKV